VAAVGESGATLASCTCETTAPSTAMPTVPPTCRTVWTRPDAWPRWATGAVASASVLAGDTISPSPQPIST
jgi:hypothetical protein